MEQIWWEKVPNAHAFVVEIANTLLEEKSILLQSEDSIPWRSTFVETVVEMVRQQDSTRHFEQLDHVDDPGAYLLKNYCKAEKRALYRPNKGYARFLAENDDIVLHSNYLWVTVDSLTQLEAWSSFVSDYVYYREGKRGNAIFILEWRGEKQLSVPKGIFSFSLEDSIGEYDRIVFATLASSSVQSNAWMKEYLVELAVNTVENDVELCARCVADHEYFIQSPYESIQGIMGMFTRSNGEPFQYSKSHDDVDRCIWRTQIRTIYPLLEEYREELVERHAEEIRRELPIQAPYGEQFTDPKDVELGVLIYMAASGRIHLTQQEYDRLDTYRNARNRLAHLGILNMEEIQSLI